MLTNPLHRPFRFGVTLTTATATTATTATTAGGRREWLAKCRRAESIGYDVIGLPDHLGMPAPFPAIMAAAEATSRVRLATFVLCAPFYNAALLARDAASVDGLTGGRLELGIGTGYVRAEFESAGIAWPSAGERVRILERTAVEVRKHLAERGCRVPLLIGARGDGTVMAATRHADIIGFTGIAPGADGDDPTMDDAQQVAERVGFASTLLGRRAADVELNFLLGKVLPTTDRRALGDAAEYPTLLAGTPAQMAEDLRRRRAELGLSYFTVLESEMEAFAPVIEQLR